ncbi:YdcF family protein [Alkalibacillus aidingensis]|uniref:YdcF family protein n=1 Tax=Alkalibacillus aidingensis TaxID=2747607 RepID=UPI001660F20F|nr:YdcF family protein [Alkalibacillus aidingensis]
MLNQLKKFEQKHRRKWVLFIVLMITWFAVHTVVMVIDGVTDDLEKSDVAVVLGNKVERSGEPSDRLQARLDKAVDLYERGYFDHIIVSGGIGEEGFDEADVMRAYLTEKEVPIEKVTTDSNGYNTYMTAENTKSLQEDLDIDSVTVISQYHHLTRTKLAFHKVGFDQVYSGHAEYVELRDVYSVVREFVAYYAYLFK